STLPPVRREDSMLIRSRAALVVVSLTGFASASDETPFAGPCIPSAWASSVAVADLDLDGVPDLCLTQTDGQLAVRLGQGGGEFAAPWLLPVTTSPGYLTNLQLADIDSDGRLDALAEVGFFDGSTGSVHAFLGAGDGTFTPAGTWPGFPSF